MGGTDTVWCKCCSWAGHLYCLPHEVCSRGGGGVSVNKILPFNTRLTSAVGRFQVKGFFAVRLVSGYIM